MTKYLAKSKKKSSNIEEDQETLLYFFAYVLTAVSKN